MSVYTAAMEDYLSYCRDQKQLSWHTTKAYRIDLKQFQNCTGIMSYPDKVSLQTYAVYLHHNYMPKSVKRKIASIRSFCSWLVSESLIEISPFTKVNLRFREPQVLPRYVSLRDIESLLHAAYSETRNHDLSDHGLFTAWRDVAVLEMLFATGMRVSELCSLKIEYLDLDTGVVRIFGKGSRERIITIGNAKVLESLRTYRACCPETNGGTVFLNRVGKPLSDQSVRIIIRRCALSAGIKQHITPHMIRHSVATLLLEQGMDIRFIQQVLGHSSIKTTQIYTHIAMPQQARLLASLHPRNQISPEC